MSIPRLVRADNGFYYAVWTEQRRSRRESMGCKEAAPAQARFAQWLLLRGQDRKAVVEHTVAELWAAYCEHHEVAAVETRKFSWKNLEPHFGALRVSDVTPDRTRTYERLRTTGKIGRPSKPATIRRELNALLGCLGWAAGQRIIAKADVPELDLPQASEPRDRWLSLTEMQKLLNAAAARRRGPKLATIEIFLWLALETAARKGAIAELTWDRVDFETGVIHYDVPGRVKTKKRRSAPPISKSLRPVLERAYRERGDSPFVLGGVTNFNDTLERVAEDAGVPDVSPHVLRHTAATHMARKGVPLWIIAGVLGNTMAMVESTYAKHCPDAQRTAVEAISGQVLETVE
jgi:integrase